MTLLLLLLIITITSTASPTTTITTTSYTSATTTTTTTTATAWLTTNNCISIMKLHVLSLCLLQLATFKLSFVIYKRFRCISHRTLKSSLISSQLSY